MEFRHLGKSGLKISAVSLWQSDYAWVAAASIPRSVVSSRPTVPSWARLRPNNGCDDL